MLPPKAGFISGVEPRIELPADSTSSEKTIPETTSAQTAAPKAPVSIGLVSKSDRSLRTHATPSRRWQATQAKLARLHASVCDGRMNALHQLTTVLTKRCGVIVIEDLNVAGMLANHGLARRIAGASWGQLRRQLAYKTEWRGSQLNA